MQCNAQSYISQTVLLLAQKNFSEKSVFRSAFLSVCKLLNFSTSHLEPLSQIQSNFETQHPWIFGQAFFEEEVIIKQ